MEIMDLSHRQSGCSPPHCGAACAARSVLFLGAGYKSFLFAALPPGISANRLLQARLILFKIPDRSAGAVPGSSGQYHAHPLTDFYSIHGHCYAPPAIDASCETIFFDDPHRCVLEIDVTELVRGWLRGAPENFGILLGGGMDTRRLACGSCFHRVPGMRPILRLGYEGPSISPVLSEMDCIVTVGS